MFSQRGIWILGHDRHGMEMLNRSANAMLLNGVDAELHDAASVRRHIPGLNDNPRFPIHGALNQPRAGTARHDAVAWGYARAASSLGVDIIQNCEIGRAHVRPPVTTAPLVCRLLLDKKKNAHIPLSHPRTSY